MFNIIIVLLAVASPVLAVFLVIRFIKFIDSRKMGMDIRRFSGGISEADLWADRLDSDQRQKMNRMMYHASLDIFPTRKFVMQSTPTGKNELYKKKRSK